MSRDSLDRAETGPDHDGTKRFAAALGVDRNAKLAAGSSFVLAVLLYGLFVLVPGETAYHPVLYLALASVVWFALTLTLTLVLTAYAAWKLLRRGGDES